MSQLTLTRKPKNAKSKRVLKTRQPKVIENVKSGIFIRGPTTSAFVNTFLSEMVSFYLFINLDFDFDLNLKAENIDS